MNTISRIRIGIISDTHGHLDERVADIIADCDIAVHAGDIMGQNVLEKMQPKSGQIIAVRGNNDSEFIWPTHEHDTLKDIDHVASMQLPGGKLVVVHGHQHGGNHPQHDEMREHYSDARAIVYGHSHKMVCDTDCQPWVINPGAAGRVRTRGGPSCLVLDATHEHWEVESIRFPEMNA